MLRLVVGSEAAASTVAERVLVLETEVDAVVAVLCSSERKEVCRTVGRSLRAQPASNDKPNAKRIPGRIIVTLQLLVKYKATDEHAVATAGHRKGGPPAFPVPRRDIVAGRAGYFLLT